MQAQIEQIVKSALEKLKADISANISKVGARATGKTQNSMEVKVTKDDTGVVGVLSGRPFFGALETGSRPWKTQYFKTAKDGHKYPSAPKAFIDTIREWMASKGVSLNPWSVATKIMAEGSKLYREGGRTDVYTGAIDQMIPKLQGEIAEAIGKSEMAKIVERLKKQDND